MKNINLSLQNVRKKDNNLLFNWRNEKSVVKNSISRKKVNYKNHKIWFQKRMSIEPILFWILKVINFFITFTVRLQFLIPQLIGTIIMPPPTPNKPAIKPDIIPVIRKIIIKLINFYRFVIFFIVEKY